VLHDEEVQQYLMVNPFQYEQLQAIDQWVGQEEQKLNDQRRAMFGRGGPGGGPGGGHGFAFPAAADATAV
jgi:hypothetical protein